MAQAPAEGFGVLLIYPVEPSHHDTLVPCLLAFLVINEVALCVHMHLARLEQLARQHRRERDSHKGGSTNHDGYNPTQLLEHDTRHTRQHSQRHEHRHNHQGGGDNRHPHLVGRIDSRLARVLAAVNVLRDILQHHNRIVHHHTDSHSQRTHGDDIQRRTRHLQVDKRHNQGNRNSDSDNQGRTPLAEEEQHHQDHEEQGVEDRLGQRINRVLNILRRVVNQLELHIRGQGLLNTRNLFAHVLTYLHGVRTGLLGNHQAGALATVRLLVQRQLLDGILHGGDIAHKDLTTVCRGGYYDIVYLIRGLILRAHLHLVLLFLQLHRTGRHVEVVGGYHLPHALHGQPVSVQFLLVKIDIHVAVWCTRNRQVTDTVHTVQLRDNLIVQQLIQCGIRLVSHHGVLYHRHHARAQSHHNRVRAAVRQVIFHDIHIRSHIVEHLIQVGSPLKLKGYR